jgi:hypothetical protein
MADPNLRARRGTSLTGREARGPRLRAFRHNWRQGGERMCDAHSGAALTQGNVEVLGNVRSEGFVCINDGRLRHIKQGCGKGCPCITCLAQPRRDGKPPAKTRKTCQCIDCQRYRQGMFQ